MNHPSDRSRIEVLALEQRGVFSKPDLQSVLAEPHTKAFQRRVRALEADGTLRRLCRGWYVAEAFDLPTLSQRLVRAFAKGLLGLA